MTENIPNETITREAFAQLARDTGNVVRTPQEIAATEYAERVLCRRRLLPFVQRFNKQYQAGWVHKDVCARLERFSDQVINRESPRLMLFMPPRSGKLCSHDTVVYTPSGWTTHGDLKVGDYVYHPSGRPTRIVALSSEGTANVRVRIDGEDIYVHPNHEWEVYSRPASSNMVVETRFFYEPSSPRRKPRKLTSGVIGKRGGRYQYQLPLVTGPMQSADIELPLHPYVLGLWLGDGTRKTPRICTDPRHTEHLDHAATLGYTPTNIERHPSYPNVSYYYFGDGQLLPHLQALGILADKAIPTQYLYAGTTQREALLAGLIDTDGCVDSKSRVMFSTTNASLRDGVFQLALSLGFSPYHMTPEEPRMSSSGIQGRKVVYKVGFQPTYAFGTKLPHKMVTPSGVRRRVAIESVEVTNEQRVGRCIQVDSPDGLYLVGRSLIPTHNSELASRNFPAWHLGRAPEHEFIVTSYSSSLAMKFSRSVRSLLREPAYDELFPGTKLDPDTQAVEFWQTTAGGAYMAAGVSGPLTGNGMHVGVIDDPVKNREEADSDTVRGSIKEWYTSTFYTRLAPGAGILLILTRWHHDDLAGWLLEEAKNGGDQWEVVVYPAIAEHDEKYRRKGEALHPERYDLTALERIQRAVGPRDWQALYQQQPTAAEGAFFKSDWFRYYLPNELPALDDLTLYTAWDFAIGTKDGNDYTVGITVGVDREHNIYVLDIVRGRMDALQICDAILDTWIAYPAERVGMERGQISMALGPLLEKRIAERNLYAFPYDPEGLKTGKSDKAMRATPIQGRTRQGKVLFPRHASWLASFIAELLAFPSGIHDDQVDAFAWIGQMMGLYAPPTAPKPKAPKWTDKLGQLQRLSRKTGGSTLMGA